MHYLRNVGWDNDDKWETSSGVRNIAKTHENWNGTDPKVQHSCAIVNGQNPDSVGHAGFMESSACLVNIPYVCERVPLDREPDNKCPKVKPSAGSIPKNVIIVKFFGNLFRIYYF